MVLPSFCGGGSMLPPNDPHSDVQFRFRACEFVIMVRLARCRAEGRGATFKSLRRLTVEHGRFSSRSENFLRSRGWDGGSTPSNGRKLCWLRLYFFWR